MRTRVAGNLIDLSLPGVRIPSRLAFDSSVVIDWLAAVTQPSPRLSPLLPAHLRAAQLIGRLGVEQAVGLVPSTSLSEVFHVVVKTGYRAALPNHRADLLARYPNVRRHGWEHLFKARPDLIKRFAADLHRVRRLMTGSRLLFLQPEDLGDLPSGRTLDDEMIRVMARYELDTSDAAILIEAQRAGVTSIVTADSDLRRAQLDFDIYTWL